MTDSGDVRAVVASAEEAASAGNPAAAEQFLREAARLQEASLGPVHPDLANTLNNLGVVCEITGKAEDAEQCYRRAHAIATASLPPDHPFVLTSAKNLRDFCEARGLPLDLHESAAAAAVDSPSPAAGAAVAEAARAAPADHPLPRAVPVPPPASVKTPPPASVIAAPSPVSGAPVAVDHGPAPEPGQPPRATPVRALAVVAVLIVLGFAAYRWLAPDAPASPPPAAATPAAAAPARPTEPASVAPPPSPAAPKIEATKPAAPAAAATPAAPNPPAADRGSSARRGSTEGADATPSGGAPAVVEAQLCRSLARSGAWTCVPADSPVDPGPLFFYTRLSAARDTVVRHRWYRGNRLAQAVELRVRANAASGYRTYSRNTVTAQTAGDWRVELISDDGTVLHEVRFVVR